MDKKFQTCPACKLTIDIGLTMRIEACYEGKIHILVQRTDKDGDCKTLSRKLKELERTTA